jgi:hypothetical protein
VTNYKVVVRRGAIIYEGESLSEANRSFENFVSESKDSEVLITLFQESKIVRQWYRHLNPDLHCHCAFQCFAARSSGLEAIGRYFSNLTNTISSATVRIPWD